MAAKGSEVDDTDDAGESLVEAAVCGFSTLSYNKLPFDEFPEESSTAAAGIRGWEEGSGVSCLAALLAECPAGGDVAFICETPVDVEGVGSKLIFSYRSLTSEELSEE